MADPKDAPKSLDDVLSLVKGSKKKVDAAAAGKGGPEALAGAQQDLASAKSAAGGLAKNKDKISGLLKKAGGVRSHVTGARDQIASAKGAVAAVQKGQTGAAIGLPGADKLIKSATDKLAPHADDAEAGDLKGFKVPEKLPQADANVAKAEKIVEGLNKPLAAKGALPPAPDAVALNALQQTVGTAKVQAGALAAPATSMAQALPAAQQPVAAAQKSISTMLAGPGPSVVQLKDGLPKIQNTIGDAQKLLPDPKALQDLAAKVPDVSKIADSSQKGAVALAKVPGATAAALTSTGKLPAAQTSIESAQIKLPDGAKALTDAAAKMPDVSSPVDAAKGVMDSIQPDGAAKDPERNVVDSLQENIAGAQEDATSATDAASKAKDALPDTQKKIADAQQAATAVGTGSVSPQDLQASIADAQKQAALLAPAMADAQSSSEPLAAGITAAQDKIADLQKRLAPDDDANALEDAQKQLDELKKDAAPADQIAAAEAKVQELTKQADESTPGPAAKVEDSTPADPAKLQADVDTAAKQLAAMQQALDVLKQGKAPEDQIAGAEAKVQELTKTLDGAKKKVADAKQDASGSGPASSEALDAAEKELDALKTSDAPADQIVAAEAKVADLKKQAPGAPKQKGQKSSDDEKKAVADAVAAKQELDAAQKELDALKASGAPADQISAAEAKVADLQSQIKPLTTREALLRDQLVPEVDKLVAGAKQQIDIGSKAAADAAEKIESVSNPLNKAADELAATVDSTQADLDKLQSQLQQSATQAQQASDGIQESSSDLTAAQQQVDSGTKSTDPAEIKDSVDQAADGTASVSTAVEDAAKTIADIQKQIEDAQGLVDSIKNGSGPTADAVAEQGIVEKLEPLIADLKQPLADAQKIADSANDKMSAVNDIVAKAKEETDKWPDPAAAQKSIDAAKASLADLGQKLPDAGKALADSAKAAADAQQSLDEVQKTLAGVQGGTVPADAQQTLDGIKSLLDKTAASFTILSSPLDVDALKKQVDDAKTSLGDVAQDSLSADGKDKIAGLQKFVDSATKQLGDLASGTDNAGGQIKPLQDQFDKAQQAFTSITTQAGSVAPAAVDAAGKAQQAADQLQQAVPNLSGMLSKTADAFPRATSRLTQVKDLVDAISRGSLTNAEIPGALTELQSLASGAAQQVTAAQMPGVSDALSSMKDLLAQGTDAAQSLASAGLPGDAQSLAGQLKDSLAQAQQQFGGLSDSGGSASSALSDMLGHVQQVQSLVDGVAKAGLSAADIKYQLASSTDIQSALAQAQQIASTASGLISKAQTAVSAVQGGIQQASQFASQTSKLVSDLQAGTISPIDALKQLSSAPAVQDLLVQAQKQFPQVAGLISQASDIASQVQAGLTQAQSIAASVQSGDLLGAAQQLTAIPAVQNLLGQAAAQFPEAAALVSQAAAALPAIQQSLAQAGQILGDFQSGNTAAALQQLTSLPIVQDLLGAASRQFPEAAALVTQAQAAFAAGQQGLAQANQMLTAFQQGNYADVMSQLSSLPVVQNLLAQAQQQFPAAAALLSTASQYLPAAEAALGQAQDLLAAFQQGTLTPAMLTQLPIAQALLGDAEQQLTEFLKQNVPESLQAAAAALPAIQSSIADAQALVAAAQAGDITAVAAALGLGATVAAVEAAAAALTDSPAAAAVEAGAPDAAAAAGAVQVGESADADGAAPAGANASELLLGITTPLGDGKLEIVAIEGEEQMSGLFFYKVTCTSEESDLDFTQIVGKSVTVTIDMGDDGDTKRYINGICTRFMQGPQDADENSTYILELRPWLWQLTLAQDCQIFQSKAVPDIITGIFDALGFSDYTNSTTATYTARDYCVQYRETTFDFVSRLMEDEGISYFFTHADGKHTLVLGDDSDVHTACPSAATVEYDPSENADPGTINYITMEQALTTMQFMMDDFNFLTSDTELKVTVDGTGMKVYEYPGGYIASDAGTTRANNHLGSLEMPAKILRGRSRVRTFSPGYKFTLTEHERDDVNADYVLSRVSLKADQQKYGDEFEAFPAATVFRPPLKTKKPAISGAQTAIVVGKSGEEIWTDQYGRIKVQFHWDQVGVKDENSSCWIRVSQGWAGKSWGMVFLPRVGQEVIVSFLEGDPDRPIVTGCVYNAQTTVPYTLPDDQTKSTIKSMSSKSGTIGNEIRFQDLAGSEELYMYATKDMNIRVVNNMVCGVKASYQMFIQSDDPTVDTSNQYVLSVDGNALTTVKGDSNQETHTNEGKFTQTVAKEFSLTVNGDTLTITTTGDLTIKGKSVTIESTSADVTIKSAANLTAQAAQSLTNKSGTDLTNQAGTSLSNKASVSMTNDGGVSLTNKASASQTVDGGGMLTLKGGMVQIN